ncbi:MAG: hypothetical protein IKP20_04415 [Candidatus Methanomethylophilaceae archaeon]|jgi:hypothetical protein|nr:hypothetical protein [Candidatus Methanomethylophilaceae archaeon]
MKITIRVGPDEIQLIEDYMDQFHVGNRSDFIRDAIRGYINFRRNETGSTSNSDVGGIFIHLSDLHLEILANLKKMGICLSEEEFIRKCVIDAIMPKEAENKAIDEAFASAQSSTTYR